MLLRESRQGITLQVIAYGQTVQLHTLWLFAYWHIEAVIFQSTFSNAFSWMKMYESRIIFKWSYFQKGPMNNIPSLVQIMAWRRVGTTSQYLNQCGILTDAYKRHSASVRSNLSGWLWDFACFSVGHYSWNSSTWPTTCVTTEIKKTIKRHGPSQGGSSYP